MEDKLNYYVWAGVIICVLIGLFILSYLDYSWNRENNKICMDKFPSPITKGNAWNVKYGFDYIEEGYIECCHDVLIDHKKEIECKVLPKRDPIAELTSDGEIVWDYEN